MPKSKRIGPRLCLCGVPASSTRGPARCERCRATPMPREAFAQRYCPCGMPVGTRGGKPRCDACRARKVQLGTPNPKGRRPCPCGLPSVNSHGLPRCGVCIERGRRRTARNAQLAVYGIDVDDYDAMLVAQAGVCAICQTDDPGRGHLSFSVDHEHLTNTVRGLLCHYCNVGIGHLGDDPVLLRAAADYIESHRKP